MSNVGGFLISCRFFDLVQIYNITEFFDHMQTRNTVAFNAEVPIPAPGDLRSCRVKLQPIKHLNQVIKVTRIITTRQITGVFY